MADPLRSLAACVLGALLALAWLAPLVANDKPLWADARDVQAAQLAQEELGAALDQYRTALAADATAAQASTAWTELERAWEQAAARSSAPESDVARVRSTMTECAGRPERLVEVQRLLAPWLENVELPRVRRMVGSPVLASVDSGALLRLALLPVLACLVFWTARGRLPGGHRLWWALGLAASTVLVWFGLQAVQQPELARVDTYRVERAQVHVDRVLWPLVQHGPAQTQLSEAWSAPGGYTRPNPHWLGTDGLGRDALSRLLHGSAVSLEIALLAGAVALALGWLIGTTCGLLGGWFDTLCVRLMETLASIPFLFLAIVVLALVRGRVVPSVTVALLVAAVAWVPVARLVRAQTLVERAREHVLALRVVGIPEGWILVRHILPATLPAAATAAAFLAGSAVGVEAALSWLGLATTIPQPTWGALAGEAGGLERWWLWLPPSLLVALTCACLLVLGERREESRS